MSIVRSHDAGRLAGGTSALRHRYLDVGLAFSWLTPVRRDSTLFLPAVAMMNGSWTMAI
jgi:hypothetical protein